jgi:hypothetical protein
MILRLCLNEMDLQRSKQMLALRQRQPDHLRPIFGHGSATADLMNANDPVRSNQLQHNPPLHPQLPAITTGKSHSTPTFGMVIMLQRKHRSFIGAKRHSLRPQAITLTGRR